MVSTSNDSDQSRFTDGCSFERRGATFITSDYGSLGIVAVSKQMLQGTIQGSGDKLSKKNRKILFALVSTTSTVFRRKSITCTTGTFNHSYRTINLTFLV
jgi:hypothetical protein